jgi:CBS domain-containing protein
MLADGGPHGTRGDITLAATFEETLRKVKIRELQLSPPLKVQKGTALREAISLMQERKQPCLLVLDGEKVAGIFTERDILYKLTAPGKDLSGPVDAVMTAEPRTLHPEDLAGKAIRLMTEKSYRHIPLADDDGKLLGYVTARDIIVYIAENFPTEVFNLPPVLHQTPMQAEGG